MSIRKVHSRKSRRLSQPRKRYFSFNLHTQCTVSCPEPDVSYSPCAPIVWLTVRCDASVQALKSAEKKTKQTLKDASTIAKIKKARKIHWLVNFLSHLPLSHLPLSLICLPLSSDLKVWEVLLVHQLWEFPGDWWAGPAAERTGGQTLPHRRSDAVYIHPHLLVYVCVCVRWSLCTIGDLYVHADLRGAPSVIIKNTGGIEIFCASMVDPLLWVNSILTAVRTCVVLCCRWAGASADSDRGW